MKCTRGEDEWYCDLVGDSTITDGDAIRENVEADRITIEDKDVVTETLGLVDEHNIDNSEFVLEFAEDVQCETGGDVISCFHG
jgi:hypothetical protein